MCFYNNHGCDNFIHYCCPDALCTVCPQALYESLSVLVPSSLCTYTFKHQNVKNYLFLLQYYKMLVPWVMRKKKLLNRVAFREIMYGRVAECFVHAFTAYAGYQFTRL